MSRVIWARLAVIWGDLGVVEVVIWRHLVVIWGGRGRDLGQLVRDLG